MLTHPHAYRVVAWVARCAAVASGCGEVLGIEPLDDDYRGTAATGTGKARLPETVWWPTHRRGWRYCGAMTFRLEDDALYLLDRPANDNTVRLLRIQLLTGRLSVLVDKLLKGPYDLVTLAIGYQGDLLLGAARHGPGLTRLAHLNVRGDEVAVIDRFSNMDISAFLAAGSVWENRLGVHFLIESPNGYRPHQVPRSAFVSAPPAESAKPVFP